MILSSANTQHTPFLSDSLNRRKQIIQACIWSASTSLAEHGDPVNSAAIVYAFEDFCKELENHTIKKPDKAH